MFPPGSAVYSAVGLPQQFGLCWVLQVEISLYIQEQVLWLWRAATQLGTTKHVIFILRLQVNPLINGILCTSIVSSGITGPSWGHRCPAPLFPPSTVPGPPPFNECEHDRVALGSFALRVWPGNWESLKDTTIATSLSPWWYHAGQCAKAVYMKQSCVDEPSSPWGFVMHAAIWLTADHFHPLHTPAPCFYCTLNQV